MLDRVLEVMFPRRCAGCDAGPWPFCPDCRSALVVLAPPWCERCGRPWRTSVVRCRDCPPAALSGARAPFAFEGPARRAIHRLKYSGWRGVGDALARAMVASGPRPPVEVVTWVPLGRRRLAERGFDQARVLAQGVAGELGLPCIRLLRRAVSSAPQARRSGAERRVALLGGFQPVIGARARGEGGMDRVLLVDDVLTTGATAGACAQALLAGGARAVHLLAAARAFNGSAYTRAGSRPGLWLPGGAPR